MKSYYKFSRSMFILLILFLIPLNTFGQDEKEKKEESKSLYEFTIEQEVKRTPVKNQYRTGTCWCFATVSFLESEILRMGGEEVDLSEMFIVRQTYPRKASNYIRLHGNSTFGQGGQSHDVLEQVSCFGVAPEEIYDGMCIGEKKHNHGEMASVLKGFLDGIVKKRGGKLTSRWMDAFKAVLNVYLGTPPEKFKYKGKTYTPKSFAEHLGIDAKNYIELTSYTHHEFYKGCRIEVPDNWTYNCQYYNLPINVLEKVIDNAIKKGYSVAWDGDVSEKDFSSRKTGYAIVPLEDREEDSKEEKEITQELRQKTFDNFTTTDDHLMHIVGIAHDQDGTKFYLTKNSGGTDRKNEGYVYMSRSYVRLKTIALMIHKDALSGKLKSKLGLN